MDDDDKDTEFKETFHTDVMKDDKEVINLHKKINLKLILLIFLIIIIIGLLIFIIIMLVKDSPGKGEENQNENEKNNESDKGKEEDDELKCDIGYFMPIDDKGNCQPCSTNDCEICHGTKDNNTCSRCKYSFVLANDEFCIPYSFEAIYNVDGNNKDLSLISESLKII